MITWTEEQDYIIRYDRPANLLVSAAAGSGKTAVLTERIVQRALAKKIRLPHILVMTFTELAAKQMKQRIAARFREVRKEDADTLLQELPLAQISTVHAFCNQVLSAHLDRFAGKDGNPLLEPGYRIADESLSKTLLDQSLDSVISSLNIGLDAMLRKTDPQLSGESVPSGLPDEEESPAPFILTGEERTHDEWYRDYRALSLAFAPRLTDVPFRKAIVSMLNHLHNLPHYENLAAKAVEQLFTVAEAFPSDAISSYWWERFEKAYDTAKGALEDLRQTGVYASFKNPESNPIRQLKTVTLTMEKVIGQLAGPHVRTAVRWDAIVRAGQLIDELKFPSYMARSANESIQERNRYLDRFWQDVLPLAGLISDRTPRTKRLEPYLEGFPPVFTMSTSELRRDLIASARVAARFIEVVLLVDADYKKRRFSDNVILFSDIEHGALALLENEDIGAYYRNHFDEVYVDEYQDTSSIQDAIIKAVRRDNVFMVGDVKQSIYRFRYANPKLFAALADASVLISPDQDMPDKQADERTSAQKAPLKTVSEKALQKAFQDTPTRESIQDTLTSVDNADSMPTTPSSAAGYLALLSRNFRSRPGILEFVNDFFSAFLTRESGDIEYDETQAMTPVRPVSESDLPPVVLSVACMTDESAEDDDDTSDAYHLSQTEREAVMAADIIQNLLANGAAPESIALLLPTNDNCRVYGDVLKAYHIPIVTRTGPVFPDNPVTRQVEALLALLDNPLQDIPLINTLLGPFVLESFTEEELVALAGTAAPDQSDLSGDSDDSEPYRGESHPSETAKMARNATSNQGDLPDETESGISRSTKKDMLIDAVFHLESLDKPTKTFALKAEQEKERSFHRRFQAVAEGNPAVCQTLDTALYQKVRRFSKTIERWRLLAQELPACELIDVIFSETDYEAFVATLPQSEHYAADLDMLKELLEGDPGAPLPDLREALNRVREAREQARTIPPSESALLPGAVHVLTRHSSKGLQWDHVILGGLFRPNERRDSSEIITFSEQQGLSSCTIADGGLAVYNNPLHERAVSMHTRDAQAESWRLLYVSMTRAKERLFLLFPAKKTVGDIGRVNRLIERVYADTQTMTDDMRKQRSVFSTELASATNSDAELILGVLALREPFILDAMINSEGRQDNMDEQEDNTPSCVITDEIQSRTSTDDTQTRMSIADAQIRTSTDDVQPDDAAKISLNDEELRRKTVEEFSFEHATAYVERWIDIYKRVEERSSSPMDVRLDENTPPDIMCGDDALFESEKAYQKLLLATIPRKDAANTPAKISVTELKRLREEATLIAAEGEFADAPVPIYTSSFEGDREGAHVPSVMDPFVHDLEGSSVSIATSSFEGDRVGAHVPSVMSSFERDHVGDHAPFSTGFPEYHRDRKGAHDIALTMRRREGEDPVKGVVLGSVLHTVFQFLDIESLRNASEEEGVALYHKQLDDLRDRDVLDSAEHAAAIPFSKAAILWTKSDLAGRLLSVARTTGKVYREMPFTLAVPSKTLMSSWAEDEMTLVQGMIDLWFVEENGDAILIDFKSDRLPDHDEEIFFKKRYGFQLQTYAEAIERATGRTVRERILWLIRAGRGLIF